MNENMLHHRHRLPAFRLSSLPGGMFSTTAVFLCIAVIYWYERSRSPGWGNSAGFLVTALEGFSWSPVAIQHFLYANLIAGLVQLFPAVDTVTLLVCVSVIFALLTLVQTYRTCLALTANRYASLLGVITLAFSFTFWRQAEQIEVYTFATFCASSAIHAMFTDIAEGTRSHVLAAGIWMGLAFLVHIQIILFVPLFTLYLFDAGRGDIRQSGLSLLAAGSGIGLLVIIAVLSPACTVGEVFISSGFKDEVMAADMIDALKGLIMSAAYAGYAFHIHLVAILVGMVRLGRTTPKILIYCLTGITPVWLFAMRYPVTDQYVFFLNAYLILAVAGSVGYAALFARIPRKAVRTVVLVTALVLPYIAYETATYTAVHIPRLQAFHARKSYKGGLAYFLRPGLRTSPDLFELVRQQDRTVEPLVTHDTELWERLRYNTHRYWELKELRKH